MNVKVGDRLIWRSLSVRYSGEQEIEVQRVGRRWAYARVVGYSREVKFDATTGYEDSGQYASVHRALTAEQDAEEKRRAALLEALKGHGVELGFGRGRDITTDQLQQIADVLG